jgi:hypothetical protein
LIRRRKYARDSLPTSRSVFIVVGGKLGLDREYRDIPTYGMIEMKFVRSLRAKGEDK